MGLGGGAGGFFKQRELQRDAPGGGRQLVGAEQHLRAGL